MLKLDYDISEVRQVAREMPLIASNYIIAGDT
jgi:hypothetical protein